MINWVAKQIRVNTFRKPSENIPKQCYNSQFLIVGMTKKNKFHHTVNQQCYNLFQNLAIQCPVFGFRHINGSNRFVEIAAHCVPTEDMIVETLVRVGLRIFGDGLEERSTYSASSMSGSNVDILHVQSLSLPRGIGIEAHRIAK